MPHTFQNVKTSLTLQHPSAIHKVQLANRAHKRGFFSIRLLSTATFPPESWRILIVFIKLINLM